MTSQILKYSNLQILTPLVLHHHFRASPSFPTNHLQRKQTGHQRVAIDLHPVDPIAVADLALRYQLSAYDAAYLWLAADLKCPLATFDGKLALAARTHLASLP